MYSYFGSQEGVPIVGSGLILRQALATAILNVSLNARESISGFFFSSPAPSLIECLVFIIDLSHKQLIQ